MRALLVPAMGLALMLAVPTGALAQANEPLPAALQDAISACSTTSAAECEQLIRIAVQALSANNPALRDQLFVGALLSLQEKLPANSPVVIQVAGNILPDISAESRGTVQAMASPTGFVSLQQTPPPSS